MTLLILHILHLVSGVVWLGGVLFQALVLMPALARAPAAEARAQLERIGPAAASLMGAAGGLVMVTGLLRAWLGGGVQSFADLAHGYGLTVLVALVITMLAPGHDGMVRARLRRLLDDPAAYAAQAPALTWRNAVVTGLAGLVILILMARLGMGYH